MNSELKPCPFCGREAMYEPFIGMIGCTYCGAALFNFSNEENAAKAWNDRYERTCRIKYIGESSNHKSLFMCTNCKTVDAETPEEVEDTKYCPHCGAKVTRE